MKKSDSKSVTRSPKYAIEIFQEPGGWVGEFLVDGASVFNTGIPNSFQYVYARLEPWFEQAPHTVLTA